MEIPDSVITAAVVDYSEAYADRGHFLKYSVEVYVGGVPVMHRTYHNDYLAWKGDGSPSFTYAETDEAAKEMALSEFGHQIRKLIGELE